jgi:hypothetical protein
MAILFSKLSANSPKPLPKIKPISGLNETYLKQKSAASTALSYIPFSSIFIF